MKQTLKLFADIQTRALSQPYIPTELQAIKNWVLNTALRVQPSTSLRPDNIEIIRASIFKDTVVRDFINDLSFRFFTLCNEEEDFLNKLSVSIANGITSGNKSTISIIPNKLKESLMFSHDSELVIDMFFLGIPYKSKTTLPEFLKSNKYLIIMYLIILTNIPSNYLETTSTHE